MIFLKNFPKPDFKIYIFEISAKFLNCLPQHFFRAVPSPVEIVCSRGWAFLWCSTDQSINQRQEFKWKLLYWINWPTPTHPPDHLVNNCLASVCCLLFISSGTSGNLAFFLTEMSFFQVSLILLCITNVCLGAKGGAAGRNQVLPLYVICWFV